jgi:PadR family transcriptional regulator, regulatory protein PadR
MCPKEYLSHAAAVILQAIANDYRYGFDVMDVTGLPSGTIYPALRRLEEMGLVESHWEKEQTARREQRPLRKYYEVTAAGEAALGEAVKRYRFLERLLPAPAATRKSKPSRQRG